jgi:hypothetical protein
LRSYLATHVISAQYWIYTDLRLESLKTENLYVMLSRTSNWEDVAILRPFDDRIFNVQPNEKLLRYLEDQDKMTQQIYEGKMRTSMYLLNSEIMVEVLRFKGVKVVEEVEVIDRLENLNVW